MTHGSVPPIRLLTIITKLELGGAQQVALSALAGISSARYRKFLVAGAGGLLDREASGLKGVTVFLWKHFRHPISPWWDVATYFRLVALMRRERIQIVHTHSSKAGFLGRLAAAAARVPVVIHTVHGWPFHERQPWVIRSLYILLERWAARFTTRLIAVSQATRELGLAAGIGQPGQYVVIYPGSDLRGFKPGSNALRRQVRREFKFPAESPLVGMVACLKPQKAPAHFVRAAAEVSRVAPAARFLLVGDGTLRPEVEAEVARLGLSGKLALAGWRQDVARLMGAMDILAQSSLWEGLPCVFAQAYAAGLPVVATRVGGAGEIIDNGRSGLLTAPADPKALAEGILKLIQDGSLRRKMGKVGRSKSPRFSQSAMVAQISRLYEILLRNLVPA